MLTNSPIGIKTWLQDTMEQTNSRTDEFGRISNRKQTSVQHHPKYLLKWHHQASDEMSQILSADIDESINKQARKQIDAGRKNPQKFGIWLEAALADCREEALDEGIEVPSKKLIHKAKLLIEHISSFVEERPDIYPMDEGSIAIDFRNPSARSGIFFVVDSDGSGALFTRSNNHKGRIRETDAERLLDENLKSKFKRFRIS